MQCASVDEWQRHSQVVFNNHDIRLFYALRTMLLIYCLVMTHFLTGSLLVRFQWEVALFSLICCSVSRIGNQIFDAYCFIGCYIYQRDSVVFQIENHPCVICVPRRGRILCFRNHHVRSGDWNH